jgi:hypothetical protein
MNSDLEKLSVPIVLIGSLWSAMGVVLEFFKIINERRDLVLTLIEKCGKCVAHPLRPLVIYWTNMFPLSLGVFIFLIIMTGVLIKIPTFITFADGQFAAKLQTMAYIIAIPLAFAAVAFLIGGIFDLYFFVVQDLI